LTEAEDPLGGGCVQTSSQRRQYNGNLLRWGFQAVQGRVAPGTEGRAAGLKAEGLDPLSLTMLAIAKKTRGCDPQ